MMGWADGDAEIVGALATYQTLTSSQLARLTGRGAHLVRRRYRLHLGPADILKRLKCARTEEAAYTLGKAGRALVAEQRGIEEKDLDFALAKTVKGLFFVHHTLTRDVLISIELACRGEGPLSCRKVIGEWILDHPESRNRDKRVRIYERFGGGVVCRPDGVVLVSPSESQVAVALAVEADRGTESMRAINEKLEGYWQLWLRFFKASGSEKYLGADALRVLFVLGNAESGEDGKPPMRITSMLRELAGFVRARALDTSSETALSAFRRCFLFARADDLTERTVFGDIWWNTAGERTALYRPAPKEQAA